MRIVHCFSIVWRLSWSRKMRFPRISGNKVRGYGLTTAEILCRMPDHPSLLQTYVWQNYDLFPNFPVLKDFLAFWHAKLEGPLYAVTVAYSKLIKPAELHAVDGVFRLH
jgi:uncharacterized protein Usg